MHNRFVFLDVAFLPVVNEQLIIDEEEDDSSNAGEDGPKQDLQPSFHLEFFSLYSTRRNYIPVVFRLCITGLRRGVVLLTKCNH